MRKPRRTQAEIERIRAEIRERMAEPRSEPVFGESIGFSEAEGKGTTPAVSYPYNPDLPSKPESEREE